MRYLVPICALRLTEADHRSDCSSRPSPRLSVTTWQGHHICIGSVLILLNASSIAGIQSYPCVYLDACMIGDSNTKSKTTLGLGFFLRRNLTALTFICILWKNQF